MEHDAESTDDTIPAAWLSRVERRRRDVAPVGSMPSPGAPRDWPSMLVRLRDELERLCSIKALRDDRESTAILRRLADASDMEAFDRLLDALLDRVVVMGGDPGGGTAAASVAAILRQRTPGHAAIQAESDGRNADRPSRTFLRL